MTLQDKLEAIRQAVEARNDVDYAPLLAVVREAKNILCEDLECFADGRYTDGARRSHLHLDYITRNWNGLPQGALAGALLWAGYRVPLQFPKGTGYQFCFDLLLDALVHPKANNAACDAVLLALGAVAPDAV